MEVQSPMIAVNNSVASQLHFVFYMRHLFDFGFFDGSMHMHRDGCYNVHPLGIAAWLGLIYGRLLLAPPRHP